jgi:hypothetical protein
MNNEEESIEQIKGSLRGVKSLACKRGYIISNLEREVSQMLIISSKLIIECGGEDEIRKYRISLNTGQKAYCLTTTGQYTNKKGRTHTAQFLNDTIYICKGSTPKYTLAWCKITEENFDTNWTIDEDTGLLIALVKRVNREVIVID